MRRTFRRLKERHGVTARRVAVRAHKPWYWRAALGAVLLLCGYAFGIWHAVSSGGVPFRSVSEQDKALLAQLVLAERQLQVERAAQDGTAREIAALQGEVMQLKEEVAFYNSILSEGGASGVANLHSVKVEPGKLPGEYAYRILLVQSGRHDRTVEGTVRITLLGISAGQAVARSVEPAGQQGGVSVKFKYYQRVDGTFQVPDDVQADRLRVEFAEAGAKRPKLTKEVDMKQ